MQVLIQVFAHTEDLTMSRVQQRAVARCDGLFDLCHPQQEVQPQTRVCRHSGPSSSLSSEAVGSLSWTEFYR